MTNRAAIKREAARLRALFEAKGATPLETAILQPAETLLDLYGEDIRARAFVTTDATRAELMLRPDFTLPVVQMHMQDAAEPACYTYAGEVFRRQESDPTRPSEYMQVGFELFDGVAPEAADARVFSEIYNILDGHNLRAATGDIGILMAAVSGLQTTDRRKAALMRHIWRPSRFRALIDRFSGRVCVPEHRVTLLAASKPLAEMAPLVGLRSRAEIEMRIDALRSDAQTAPISQDEVALLDAILSIRAPSLTALKELRDIASDMQAIGPAVARLAKRLDALEHAGIDAANLEFEASFGRTQMEYYDGFVFGFFAPDRPDLPAVSTGGRYDALTRQLGQGREIMAVGGVIRPDILLELGGGV